MANPPPRRTRRPAPRSHATSPSRNGRHPYPSQRPRGTRRPYSPANSPDTDCGLIVRDRSAAGINTHRKQHWRAPYALMKAHKTKGPQAGRPSGQKAPLAVRPTFKARQRSSCPPPACAAAAEGGCGRHAPEPLPRPPRPAGYLPPQPQCCPPHPLQRPHDRRPHRQCQRHRYHGRHSHPPRFLHPPTAVECSAPLPRHASRPR